MTKYLAIIALIKVQFNNDSIKQLGHFRETFRLKEILDTERLQGPLFSYKDLILLPKVSTDVMHVSSGAWHS